MKFVNDPSESLINQQQCYIFQFLMSGTRLALIFPETPEYLSHHYNCLLNSQNEQRQSPFLQKKQYTWPTFEEDDNAPWLSTGDYK